jgi:phosphotransacetylase
MMVNEGEADALVMDIPEVILQWLNQSMLQLIEKAHGASIATNNMMMTARGQCFIDTAININPSADDLVCKIAIMTAKRPKCLG